MAAAADRALVGEDAVLALAVVRRAEVAEADIAAPHRRAELGEQQPDPPAEAVAAASHQAEPAMERYVHPGSCSRGADDGG